MLLDFWACDVGLGCLSWPSTLAHSKSMAKGSALIRNDHESVAKDVIIPPRPPDPVATC